MSMMCFGTGTSWTLGIQSIKSALDCTWSEPGHDGGLETTRLPLEKTWFGIAGQVIRSDSGGHDCDHCKLEEAGT